MTVRLLCLVLALSLAAASAGQTPAPKSGSAGSGTSAQPPLQAGPTPPADYAYTTDGRRDPFVSLVQTGSSGTPQAAAALAKRPPGVAGLLISEIVVRGLVESQGQWVAIVGSPDGKTHSVRPGDRLMDGTVRSVTAQALVMMQEVNDPMSLEKQREVRKYLRGGEEVK